VSYIKTISESFALIAKKFGFNIQHSVHSKKIYKNKKRFIRFDVTPRYSLQNKLPWMRRILI